MTAIFDGANMRRMQTTVSKAQVGYSFWCSTCKYNHAGICASVTQIPTSAWPKPSVGSLWKVQYLNLSGSWDDSYMVLEVVIVHGNGDVTLKEHVGKGVYTTGAVTFTAAGKPIASSPGLVASCTRSRLFPVLP